MPGTRGFETPVPLEFASLVPPRSPNACLALPEGHPGNAHLRTPRLPAAPQAVFEALLAHGDAQARTTCIACWPERRQAQWLVRSATLRFPDMVVAEAQPAGEGTALFLYSRSLIGWSDLGVNRERLGAWIRALEAALPAAPVESTPPSRFARALAARCAGRHVLIAGPAGDAPSLVLEALAAGALDARVLGPARPAGADARLIGAGERLGLASVAEALLDRAGVGESPAAAARFARTDAAAAWWLAEPLGTPDLAARLGKVDLVADATGLHLRPEPVRHLQWLRHTGARRLLLSATVLPEGLLPPCTAAGSLDTAACASLDAALRARGLALPQLTLLPGGLREEGAQAAGLAEPWWWFLTQTGVGAMIEEAGWAPRAYGLQGHELLVEAEAFA